VEWHSCNPADEVHILPAPVRRITRSAARGRTVSRVTDPLTDVLSAFDRPFRELAAELARRHPEAIFQVLSCPVGSATVFQGHALCLECVWQGRSPDEPDNVALEITLCHLTTTPRINADVCWGHGPVEAEFAPECTSSDNWPELTPEVFRQLLARMPGLMDEFRRVVAQGWPEE
jgi:hypothetical protein